MEIWEIYDFGFLGLKGFLLITCFFFFFVDSVGRYILYTCLLPFLFIIIVIVLNLVFGLFDDVWHFGSPSFGAFESEIAFSWSKASTYIICLFAHM